MTYEGKKMEKKKTAIHQKTAVLYIERNNWRISIHQKTLNPVFNESFTFSVPYERIRHTSLVISVMDHDPSRDRM